MIVGHNCGLIRIHEKFITNTNAYSSASRELPVVELKFCFVVVVYSCSDPRTVQALHWFRPFFTTYNAISISKLNLQYHDLYPMKHTRRIRHGPFKGLPCNIKHMRLGVISYEWVVRMNKEFDFQFETLEDIYTPCTARRAVVWMLSGRVERSK